MIILTLLFVAALFLCCCGKYNFKIIFELKLRKYFSSIIMIFCCLSLNCIFSLLLLLPVLHVCHLVPKEASSPSPPSRQCAWACRHLFAFTVPRNRSTPIQCCYLCICSPSTWQTNATKCVMFFSFIWQAAFWITGFIVTINRIFNVILSDIAYIVHASMLNSTWQVFISSIVQIFFSFILQVR